MNEEKKKKTINSIYEWLDSVVFALAAVILLFSFVVKSYIVQGSSMDPTLHTGDRVFVYGLFYKPASGDVVIIDGNNDYHEPLVKRVVAVAGQTVDIDPATFVITVDGEPFESPTPAGSYNLQGDVTYPLTVPEGYVFVMGDNRAVSIDSRDDRVGFIDERSVLGKEFFRIKR